MLKIFSEYRRWFVLLGLMLTYAATNGIIVHTLPLIYPSLIDEFGWTVVQMTLPATIFYVFGAITSPPAGVLLDRFSPRLVMLWGSGGIILSLFCFSLIQSLWHMAVIFFFFGLSLSLCGLAASMVILTRWFEDLRGRATGFLLMSSSFGGAVFPLILGSGIDSYGWREAILIVSVIAVLMIIPSLLFLVLDGAVPRDKRAAPKDNRAISGKPVPVSSLTDNLSGPTLREAIKQPTFYLVAFVTGSVWFCVVALLQHQVIYLVKDIGMDGALIKKMASLLAIFSVLGKIGFGLLSDYLNKEISMILSIATFIGGLLILGHIGLDDSSLIFVYAAVTGLGFSGSFTMVQLLIAQHFAGISYGKILAILVMIDSLAGGLGTRAIAMMRENTGTYELAFNTLIVVCSLAIACLFMIRLLNSTNQTINTHLKKGVDN